MLLEIGLSALFLFGKARGLDKCLRDVHPRKPQGKRSNPLAEGKEPLIEKTDQGVDQAVTQLIKR